VHTDVLANTLLELVGTDPPLEHGQHGRALLVSDGIECFRGLSGRRHGLPNRARGVEAIDVHRLQRVARGGKARVERRFPLVDDFALHPRGKAFVQPEVVPPRHGHQIAEPLMGELVGDDDRLAALGGRGRMGRVEQQHLFAVRDEPRVLHGPSAKIGNGNGVELGIRKGRPEVVGELLREPRRRLEGHGSEL
jgi:hypothetical protein